MSTTNSSIRTPLARVRYLGSAHAGTTDFFRQRLTALGMLLLVLPVAIIVMMLMGSNHATAIQTLRSPLVAIILVLFVIASCWHMKIGMQVVIEDYVHDEKLKLLAIIGNHFFTWVVALAAIYALVKLSSGV
jgi:succinate dehydrogenase / fumarate reductase membrane anchor subunit